jgi:glycosyltransferase involved in cell wall biosynthesis
MKILFITQFLPYPPDSGGKVKTWGILQLLAEKHDVFLISFVDDKKELKFEKKVTEKCSLGVKTFVTPIITSKHSSLSFRTIKGILNPIPFRVSKYYLSKTADYIKNLTNKIKFDVVYCDHLTSAPYLSHIKNVNEIFKVYDEHNINSQAMFTYAKWEDNFVRKLVYILEGIKFRLDEKKKIPQFDKIFAISPEDLKILRCFIDHHDKASFLPTPINVNNLYRFGSKNILFIGLMSWWPNEQGVIWFVNRVFPLVLKEIPEAKFQVIGDNVSNKIRALASDNVELLGYVSDLQKYYENAGVFVAPINVGGGIRIKILNAMGRGMPVISTSLGASGINAKLGRDLIIADSPTEFARGIVSIIDEQSKAEELSKNSIKFINDNYGIESAKKKLVINR